MKRATALILVMMCAPAAAEPDPAAIKAEILATAKSFEGQPDTDFKKQELLSALVEELLAITPPSTMAEKADRIVGSWRQVFGPYAYDGTGGVEPGLDTANIYQVVFPEGFYYNVAKRKRLGKNYVQLLKGIYQVETDRLPIEFVESGLFLRHLPDDMKLQDLPYAIERGDLNYVKFPSWLPPVGRRGALIETYTDEELRVTYGIGDGIDTKRIYILERVANSGPNGIVN